MTATDNASVIWATSGFDDGQLQWIGLSSIGFRRPREPSSGLLLLFGLLLLAARRRRARR